MKKTLICINCPMGCSLKVYYNKKQILKVEGGACKRGNKYAEEEIFAPQRIVTSTVKITGAAIDFLPVKTDTSIPKQLMSDIMNEVFRIKVKAPIKIGDTVCKNIADSGANLVATRTLVPQIRNLEKNGPTQISNMVLC